MTNVTTRAFDSASEEQRQRASKALVKYYLDKAPGRQFTRQQRKGFLHNGINHDSMIAGLADWSEVRRAR